MEENLRPVQRIPHEQQGNGVDAHDGEKHPCLVGKPSPADDGDQHLEELEAVDGQDAVQSAQFGVSTSPKFSWNWTKAQRDVISYVYIAAAAKSQPQDTYLST